MTQLSTFKL